MKTLYGCSKRAVWWSAVTVLFVFVVIVIAYFFNPREWITSSLSIGAGICIARTYDLWMKSYTYYVLQRQERQTCESKEFKETP